ncbi:energy transducer TonB [Thioflexithrix psekupsensis]|uniref:TonB C-terminal domain-containing protein n=1 Tax=Thioflexithrix psekupsensis TaxID=1570016 RepID=A0A251X8Y3_9GAMM|nr:energy transducer TonB [Thioflexithrix psekupsensis]OUD14395.1 hypothetical protein TPSD3_08770 [Thioflexithrix psekupsensis]
MSASLSIERLMTALFLSLVLHVFIINAVGFNFVLPNQTQQHSMQVILVQKSTPSEPNKADFLAQSNSEGSGSNDTPERPSTPLVAPFPDPHAREIATPPPPELARAEEMPETQVLTQRESAPEFVVEQHESITEIEDAQYADGDAERSTLLTEKLPTTLIQQSLANYASMQAELDEKFNDYSKRTREKRISPSTKEYKYAAYMDEWRRKVEQIGNSNYPEEARKQNLTGRLVLEVGLNVRGGVESVAVKKSSGHPLLDQAAKRIVYLASPYAPFPASIKQDIDTLYITGTWRFIQDGLSALVESN